jgi:pyruvoyl-dependent arginine decarboxylase (PvlArgDC)
LQVTEDSLIEELEQARLAALEAEQASAAVAATMGKAKVCGLLVERKETGKPGDFDNMTVEELKAFIEADLDSKPATHDGNDAER